MPSEQSNTTIKLTDKPAKPAKKPKLTYIEQAAEEAQQFFAKHKIHVVTAHFPDYMVYHCCRIGQDDNKIYGSDFLVHQCSHHVMLTGDLKFCIWQGMLEPLSRVIDDFRHVAGLVPDNVLIRETKRTKGEYRYSTRYLLQYYALRWFCQHKNQRANYHITIGTQHSDPTLAVIPVS